LTCWREGAFIDLDMRPAIVCALVGALIAGCGGSKAASPDPVVASDPGYPPAPYGYAAGEVLPDLLFAGKAVASGEQFEWTAWQMLSLGALRGNDLRLLVIEAVAAWCSDCAGDQPAMMRLENDYRSKGVVGIELLLQGALDVPATRTDLSNWALPHNLSGILLFDDSGAFERAADVGAFPTYFIVDAASMKIVARTTDSMAASPLGPTLDSLLAP
jgi:hypothetical protein